jgi:DNA (cytosine-5)-methyltransferase 1
MSEKKEYWDISKLREWDKNPRSIKEKDFERLKKQIQKLGQYKPLLVTPDGEVIGGNMRLKAYQELGTERLWVSIVKPKNDSEKMEYALSDNDRVGFYDSDMLANLMPELDIDWSGYAVDLRPPLTLDGLLPQETEEYEGESIKEFKDIKILNLYAGIGGNRKLWGDLKVTAVENVKGIAEIYRDYFPDDEIVVGDAHEYLEKNFEKFDFIWSSPPCPTHSNLRKGLSMAAGAEPKYPDMKLYEEILFLQGYFKGEWVVENVRSWYGPLVEPQERGRHYYWSSFDIPESDIFNVKEVGNPGDFGYSESSKKYGFNLDKYKAPSKYPKDRILRNMVHPKVGKFILESAYKDIGKAV